MNVFEAVKQNVTARQTAERHGIKVNRNGMAVCPFHIDRNPSLKLDRRYHCFSCQADGDAVDFVSRLFNLPCRQAAVKIADDFGISYDRFMKLDGRPKARVPTKEQIFQYEEEHCRKVLAEYSHLLRQWRTEYAPHCPEEEWHPLFVEALQRTDYTEYLLDILEYGTKDEKKEIVTDQRNEVMKLERKIGELSADHAEQRGRGERISGSEPER